jgi:hypothetical protein
MSTELELHEVTRHETDTHNSATTGQVLRDFVAGMYDEAKQHPLKLAAEAGVGAALTVGTLLAGPEVLAGVAIVGSAAGIYEAGKGLMHLMDDVKIVDNANQKYSSEEVQKARLDIRSLGSSSMDSLAMAAGGIAGLEGSAIGLSFTSVGGGHRFPFAQGVPFRQGFYTAGTMTGVEDLTKHIEDRK